MGRVIPVHALCGSGVRGDSADLAAGGDCGGVPVALAVVARAKRAAALAFVLFFRLLAEVGASRAVTVTFLIPVFGVLWGSLFLGETVSTPMLVGGAVIVLGTALATGVLRLPARR